MSTFTPPYPLNTAVLFLVFNRPDTTARVFETIRQAKPPRLYVAADGPRADREGEAEKVAKVREIATAVDWPCEVKTLFREKNLGCKHAVSSAITWFFDQEEQGIILEDDCLPSRSFFPFCENMLSAFRDDRNIWMVSGFNPRHPGARSSAAFLSKNPSVWGWASWSDRWRDYDVDMKFWNNVSALRLHNDTPDYVHHYYRKCFDSTQKGLIDTWDYQLTCLILVNNGFVVKPYANLISNIGVSGTHANKKDNNHFVPLGEFLRKGDSDVSFDPNEDIWFYESRLKTSVISRIIKKIRSVVR